MFSQCFKINFNSTKVVKAYIIRSEMVFCTKIEQQVDNYDEILFIKKEKKNCIPILLIKLSDNLVIILIVFIKTFIQLFIIQSFLCKISIRSVFHFLYKLLI